MILKQIVHNILYKNVSLEEIDIEEGVIKKIKVPFLYELTAWSIALFVIAFMLSLMAWFA